MKKILIIYALCCASFAMAAQTDSWAQQLVNNIAADVSISTEQAEQLQSVADAYIAAQQQANEQYTDDTERFFADLKKGERISILLAPAFLVNYPKEYENVLGGLKGLGVNRIISVSFGADITTWAYINYITKNQFYGGVSQPCPAVVNYIESYM